MPQVLQDRDNTASIAVERGCNCYQFRARVDDHVIDVIDSDPKFPDGTGRPSGNGIPILFPFPNRVREGRFSWEGRDYAIPLADKARNAIHGFALDTPWKLVDSGPRHLVAEWRLSQDAPQFVPHWPADALIQLRYELRGPTLHSEIRIENPGDRSLPWGFGTHAYFKLPLSAASSVEHCLIQAPAYQQWVLSTDLVPTGERRDVPAEKAIHKGAYVHSAQFDDVLTDLRPTGDVLECLIRDEEAGLEVVQRCGPGFRELVIYTPPGRDAVCMEPYTCTTDAVNLQPRGIDAGWQSLPPGGQFETWIDITARRSEQ